MATPPEIPARGTFPNLVLVGPMGGIGSGKSTFARALAEAGGELIDADQLAAEALQSPESRAFLAERFGDAVFDERGEADRKRIAEVVFAEGDAGRALLHALEQRLHPIVRERILGRLDELNRRGSKTLVVLDIPLLHEKGWHELCDHLVFVDAPDADRLKRVRTRRGWSEEDWRRREGQQTPVEVKRRLAQTTVNNQDVGASSSEDGYRSLQRAAEDLFRRLMT